MNITIRPMTPADLDAGFTLTQKLNWPHRLADWQHALQLGEGVVAEAEGRVLGTLLFWRWGDQAATLGLVIVADEIQGRGIGKQLMLAALERLSGYNVRLHATEMGKGLYEKLGFVTTGSVRQHQTRALGTVGVTPPPAGYQLRDAHPTDLTRLAELDYQANGMQRSPLMVLLARQARLRILEDQQQQVVGFAAARCFGHGYAIGPVIAASEQAAQCLVSDALGPLSGEFVRLDTNAQPSFCHWLSQLGLQEVDAPTTMVRGAPWPGHRALKRLA